MLRKLLKWSEPDDFGQQEAKFGPYRFVAWENKEYGETPVSDFSVYCRNRKEALRIGEMIARALKHSIEYNTFVSPFQ